MKIYQCPKCTYFGTNRTSALAHISAHKGKAKNPITYDTKSYDDMRFTCKLCESERCPTPSTQRSLEAMRKHIERKHNIVHPRNKHFRVVLINGGNVVIELNYAAKNEGTRVVEIADDKPTESITPDPVMHHGVIRVPVWLVVDIAAGTNTIEPFDQNEIRI